MLRLVFAFIFFFLIQYILMMVRDFVLLLDSVNDIVGNAPGSTVLLHNYLSLRLRMCSWSITSLFLRNYCFSSLLMACTLMGSSTMRLANLRQSLNMVSTDLFSMSWAGFMT